MRDDTDTINIDGYIAPDPGAPAALPTPSAPRRPDNGFLVVATVLFTGVAAALILWASDPKLTHAQVSLICAVVLITGAASAMICHFVRVWMHGAEDRLAAKVRDVVKQVDVTEIRLAASIATHAKQHRSHFYELSRDVASTNAEMEALRAQVCDFIKSHSRPADLADEFADYLKRSQEGG